MAHNKNLKFLEGKPPAPRPPLSWTTPDGKVNTTPQTPSTIKVEADKPGTPQKPAKHTSEWAD